MPIERLKARSAPKENSVEKQAEKRKHFEVAGGTTEAVRIRPLRLADKVPVLFAPGCMRKLDAYMSAIKSLATTHNREVVSFNHPRLGKEESQGSAEELENYSQEELRKAHDILDVLRHERIGKTDVIAHSEAAINTIIAADLEPDRFRNIVLYAPAGFMGGNDTVTRQMMGGWMHGMTHMPQTAGDFQQTIANLFDMYAYVALNPGRAMREQEEIAKGQIRPDTLQRLREKGIGIIIVCPVGDTIFPVEETMKHVEGKTVDGFITVRGGHTEIETDPTHIAVVANLLNTLEANKKRRQIRSGADELPRAA